MLSASFPERPESISSKIYILPLELEFIDNLIGNRNQKFLEIGGGSGFLSSLMINKGSNGALFLPEVAISNGWNLHKFLDELCRKADLTEGSWNDRDAELYVFESESWGENEFLN